MGRAACSLFSRTPLLQFCPSCIKNKRSENEERKKKKEYCFWAPFFLFLFFLQKRPASRITERKGLCARLFLSFVYRGLFAACGNRKMEPSFLLIRRLRNSPLQKIPRPSSFQGQEKRDGRAKGAGLHDKKMFASCGRGNNPPTTKRHANTSFFFLTPFVFSYSFFFVGSVRCIRARLGRGRRRRTRRPAAIMSHDAI